MNYVEIKIAEHLDIEWDKWLQGFTVTHSGEFETTLTGPVRDQADLYGIIAKMRDLGVKLISVQLMGEGSNDFRYN
jgi:hypothetical protein